MKHAETISQILAVYKKHGWNLSRVLLTDRMRKDLAEHIQELFGSADISSSNVDAAWFSRPSGKNGEAWELRHLSENPFALFEVFDRDLDKSELGEKLSEMENRLASRFSRFG